MMQLLHVLEFHTLIPLISALVLILVSNISVLANSYILGIIHKDIADIKIEACVFCV